MPPSHHHQERPPPVRALRAVVGAVLLVFGALMFLIAFLAPREDGSVTNPAILIPFYGLPLLGTAAAAYVWPGNQVRRPWIPLLLALTCFTAWIVLGISVSW
ncbi:MAG: hypothetical protein JWQ20_3272 [Conexibacter sp.]|nr:hypothetical protein [Conexibacter sp.]